VVLIRGGWGLFFLLALVARLFGVATVVEVNGIAWAELTSRGFHPVYAWAAKWTGFLQCRTADRIIAVTPAIGEELARAFGVPPDRIFPIQNGADPDQFDPVRREAARAALSIPPEKFVVGFTGVFAPWHGVLELVESARYLPPDVRSQVLYLMVGDGQVWEAVRRRVEQWGLQDVVRLPGMVPHSRIADYCIAFDAGVLIRTDPMKRRCPGSPLKFWEYLAAGLPVIVTDDCDMTPIVEGHRMGLVVREASPQALAAAITEAFRRRRELAETGRRNRELVVQRFSWLEVARRVAKVCAGEPLGPADTPAP
jgi:glycosyltransferase involved in cell wall biosynthesis